MHPLFLPSCPSFVVLSFLSFPSSVSFEVALPVQCPPVRGSCSQAGKEGVCQTQCCLHQGRQHDGWGQLSPAILRDVKSCWRIYGMETRPSLPCIFKAEEGISKTDHLVKNWRLSQVTWNFFFLTIKRLSKLRQHFSHVGFPFSITSLALAIKPHSWPETAQFAVFQENTLLWHINPEEGRSPGLIHHQAHLGVHLQSMPQSISKKITMLYKTNILHPSIFRT